MSEAETLSGSGALRASPFHQGERTIQERLGVRERMEDFGSRVIRSFMPDQHREFYSELPFLLVGHADAEGWPWASILAGKAGFLSSPDPKTLTINAKPSPRDSLSGGLTVGTRLGLLGIELTSRRRNRLAARVSTVTADGIELEIEQAFGNCPQYIQSRDVEFLPQPFEAASVATMDRLTEPVQQLIARADTFFVASFVANSNSNDSATEEAANGADVSHRGGRPGFVRVDDERTLTVPDYLGNFHFNTLGNFLVNPRAGLLFVDFESRDLVMLTGTVEILWDDAEAEFFEGAERLWRFTLDHGVVIEGGLPLKFGPEEFSRNTLLTGSWERAEALQAAHKKRTTWQDYKVTAIEDESSVIRSFHLQPVRGEIAPFEAGQFLPLKLLTEQSDGADDGELELIRTYTVSSAPAERHYRISVKREAHGQASRQLHDSISVGAVIQAKAPQGTFTFDASIDRPALLLCAGVGITPMVSMARFALSEALRTRNSRSVTLIHAARDSAQRAFFDELNQLAAGSEGNLRYISVLSNAETEGTDYHYRGRINGDLLRAVLPLDDYDCHLCGPAEFMQSMYDLLQKLGVADHRIHAEAFGPAALLRTVAVEARETVAPNTADNAVVTFSKSQFEQAWVPEEGSLLEFAESHGLTPEFSCRNGICGTCAVNVSGAVAYRTEPRIEVPEGQALLCCAAPADSESGARLTVEL